MSDHSLDTSAAWLLKHIVAIAKEMNMEQRRENAMLTWTFLNSKANRDVLGFLPSYLSEEDPEPATRQLDRNYQRVAGCGWSPMKGHTLDLETLTLKYPGDPPATPIAKTKLRDELILLYPYSFVVVVQPDGSFEVCRMD